MVKNSENIDYGRSGEEIAADYLKSKRYKILETNYRAKTGEIDIIAKDKKTIVFVEVKRRSGLKYGVPAEAVTKHKQLKITQTACIYILANKMQNSTIRFDVVEITDVEVNHIVSAFDAALASSY